MDYTPRPSGPPKPDVLHDRDREWDALAEFAADPREGARLALVYGRRRQGKTLLLELLAEATGGFLLTARQQSSAQNLADLSRAYARHVGSAVPASFADWDEAVAALLALDGPVVLDEFPYLVDGEPALPSMLQAALSPRSSAARSGRCRLILCGSAVSTMRGLLSGSAPLRGRAVAELLVSPFGYRDAAEFWGVQHDPELAFRLHALLGGTPAYRDMAFAAPRDRSEFDAWVVRRLLDQSSALFREGNLLLSEEPGLTDTALYGAVLRAVAGGATRRGEIASALGRPDSALAHPLAGLEQVMLLGRLDDAFRRNRAAYRITEPIIRFAQLITAPNDARLAVGQEARVWADATDTVRSRIYGPHLEDLARDWCLRHADPETVGGVAGRVAPATVACRECRGHELDVVVLQPGGSAVGRPDGTAIALGEVKATGKRVDIDALRRLEHIRSLLPPDRALEEARLLLFSRTGFTAKLAGEAAQRHDVALVDLERLYAGS